MALSSEFLTSREAAIRLGLDAARVQILCAVGVLAATKGTTCPGHIGWCIAPAAVEAYRAQYGARPPSWDTLQAMPRRGRAQVPAVPARAPAEQEQTTGAPIIDTVCQVYCIKRVDLLEPGRHLDRIEARRVAIYLLAIDAGLGVSAIGRLMQRDHTTVIFHIKKMKRRQTYEERWAVAETRSLLDKARGRKEGVG